MKNLFEGLKRTKFKTTLNALISLITVFVLTLSMSMCVQNQRGGQEKTPPDSSLSQENFSSDSQQNNSSNSITSEALQTSLSNDSTDSESQSSTQDNTSNESAMPSVPQGNGFRGNNIWLIVFVATLCVGSVLLFAVNFLSTKKRKEKLLNIISNGFSIKQIKKQLFLEAFSVVLVFSLLGFAASTASSSAISNVLMSKTVTQNSNGNPPSFENFDNNTSSDSSAQDDGKNNETGQRQAPPEMPENSGEMPQQNNSDNADESANENSSESSTDSQSQNQPSMTPPQSKSNTQSLIVTAIVGLISSLSLALISGISCYIPLGKLKNSLALKEFKENENE